MKNYIVTAKKELSISQDNVRAWTITAISKHKSLSLACNKLTALGGFYRGTILEVINLSDYPDNTLIIKA
jgi:hypothetical protein